MTLNWSRYKNGNEYRPGALNVQVNGMQIEDLYQECVARNEECEELRGINKAMAVQLREQGILIRELKERLKEKENDYK